MLLRVAIHEGVSYPVGKVDLLDLYPLNFREFLYAMGEKGFVSGSVRAVQKFLCLCYNQCHSVEFRLTK